MLTRPDKKTPRVRVTVQAGDRKRKARGLTIYNATIDEVYDLIVEAVNRRSRKKGAA